MCLNSSGQNIDTFRRLCDAVSVCSRLLRVYAHSCERQKVDESYQYSARTCSDTSRAITPGHWLGQKQRRLHPNTHIRYFRRRRWTTDQSGSTQRSDRARTRPESESRRGDIRSRCENIVSPDVLRSYSARRVITVASARRCDSGLHVEDRSKATCERLPVMHWCRQCSGSAQFSRAGSHCHSRVRLARGTDNRFEEP